MYRLTGLPGWMRFGYSPGWIGGSPTGLPPTTQYLMQTGQVPQPAPYAAQIPMQQPTHKDCIHFMNGFCTLNDVPVDPNEAACPSFTPKGMMGMPQAPPTTQPFYSGSSGVPPAPMFQAPTGFPSTLISQMPKEQEIQMLEGQARMVEQQLEQIKKRLEELKKEVK